MATIIFDIETVGKDFDALDPVSQEYFLKFAKSPEEKEDAKLSTSLYPLTGEVVAIGMLEAESEKGFVFYQNNGQAAEKFVEGEISFVSGTEKEILGYFWNVMKKYATYVTFNGRVFDCPYLMLRSAMLNVKPSRNLMPYRYAFKEHVDLADQLTFYDALRRKFSLHLWCRAFNIPSPKEEGVDGLQVRSMYHEGRFQDIARYCVGDIRATKALFQYWDQYLKFDSGKMY